MITLTVQDVLNAQPGLAQLGQVKFKNAKLTYRIAKATRLLEQSLKDFYEARLTLAQEMEVIDDRNTILREHKNFPEYSEVVDDLAQEEVNVDIHTIPLSWLDGYDLEPRSLIFLDFLIVDDEEEGKPDQPRVSSL